MPVSLPITQYQMGWSDWHKLTDLSALNTAPEKPGIYRVSHTDVGGVHNVGFSSDSVQKRLKNTCYEVRKDEMPRTAPVSYAPCLWALRQEIGTGLIVSWQCGFDESEAKDAKHAYLTAYQAICNTTPVSNFGGMYPGYTRPSSDQADEVRNNEASNESDLTSRSLLLDLTEVNQPTSDEWLGINWGDNQHMDFGGLRSPFPTSPGLFRVWEAGEERLTAVGAVSSINKGIPDTDLNEMQDPKVNTLEKKFSNEIERRKIHSQLIGVHYIVTKSDLITPQENSKDNQIVSKEDIQRGETRRQEFKEKLPDQVDKIAREVSAMANASGGQMMIGIADDGSVEGLKKVNSIRNRVEGVLDSNLSNFAEIGLRIANVKNKKILIVDIPKQSRKPLAVSDGRFYRREGTRSEPMDGESLVKWIRKRNNNVG